MRWYALLRALGCVNDAIRPAGSASSLADLDRRICEDGVENFPTVSDSEDESTEMNPAVDIFVQPTLFRIPTETDPSTEASFRYDHLELIDVEDTTYAEIRKCPEAIHRLEDLVYQLDKLYDLQIWKLEPPFTNEFVEQVREYQLMNPKYPFPIPATSASLLIFMNYQCNDVKLMRSLLYMCKREPTLLGNMKHKLPVELYINFVRCIPFGGDELQDELWLSLCEPEGANFCSCELTARETFLLPLLERLLTFSIDKNDISSCLQLAGFRDFTVLRNFYQHQFFGVETVRLVYILLKIAEHVGWAIESDIQGPLPQFKDL